MELCPFVKISIEIASITHQYGCSNFQERLLLSIVTSTYLAIHIQSLSMNVIGSLYDIWLICVHTFDLVKCLPILFPNPVDD